jgi:hypothetical protein
VARTGCSSLFIHKKSVIPETVCYRSRVFPIEIMMTLSSVHMDSHSESERLGLVLWEYIGRSSVVKLALEKTVLPSQRRV